MKARILSMIMCAPFLLLVPTALTLAAAVDITCSTCATVTDFKNAALADYPNNAELDFYYVVNFSSGLIGKFKIMREYEVELQKWQPNVIVTLTTTQASLSALYQKMIPTSLQPVGIPLDNGTTFTGDTQAAGIEAFLHQYFNGQVIPANTVLLVVFSDNSTAEYQLTDFAGQNWSFLSGSGTAADGTPLNDIGQTAPLPPPVKHPLIIPTGNMEPGFSSGTLGAQSFLDSMCGTAYNYGTGQFVYNCFVVHIP